MGLAEAARTNPYDLGASRRKLLALASVLAMQTPVLVLDEPTTGQDVAGVERVRHALHEAREAGRTVIAISHDMEFVADRVRAGGGHGRRSCPGRRHRRRRSSRRQAGSCWHSTYLEPPLAARVGDRLGLGSTPTQAALLSALAESAAQ